MFKIWSPVAEKAQLLLYKEGAGGKSYKQVNMQKDRGGSWVTTVNGNLTGMFYAFSVQIKGVWSSEVPDPYAKACGVNGKEGNGS